MYLNRAFFKMAFGFVAIIILGIALLAVIHLLFNQPELETVPPAETRLTDV